MRKIILISVILGTCLLTACIPPAPNNPSNICRIFQQYPSWYWDAQKAQKRWGLPIYIQMAIIHQESRFNGDAKPPREKILWVIPWFRPTSAYGYSQAIDETWQRYQKDTGRSGASRDAFDDATDFIGWFSRQAHQRIGLSQFNAYRLYLAYHEGIGGYAKRTYRKKRWLLAVARKVQRRADQYRAQLRRCQASLPKRPWWHVW